MIPVLDIVASLGGLIVPPVFDFIKKKFIKTENDTVERTIGSLATTKPEVLADYVNALTGAKDAEVRFFNRDVVGAPSLWVINLRASIRPITVATGLLCFVALGVAPEYVSIPPDIRYFFEVNISSWFGSKLKE
jgi:hypothetical protein